MEAFMGTILTVGFSYAPQGWLMCQGQLLAISQNSALFSLFGTNFGGNGTSNFGLPDLQGRASIGTGNSLGTSYLLGETTGSPSTTLTSLNLPTHTHAAQLTLTQGSQNVTIPATSGNLSVSVTVNATSNPGTSTAPTTGTNMLGAISAINPKLYTAPTTTGVVALAGTSAAVSGNASTASQTVSLPTVTGGAVAVSPAGGSQPFSLFQPSLALTFIVAINGIYPSRP